MFTIIHWQKAVSACLLSCAALFPSVDARAQLSSNPDKFLGNITTRGQVESGGEKYYTLWNQITPENESKWSSIEGGRDRYNWGGCDNAYNYAKQHGFPFKFHTDMGFPISGMDGQPLCRRAIQGNCRMDGCHQTALSRSADVPD